MADLDNKGDIDVDVVALRGSVVQSEVTLTLADTAYKLPSSPLSGRRTLIIYNNSDAIVYIGDSSVATTDGLPLNPDDSVAIDSVSDIYAVCGSAGKTVRILELS